MNTICFYFIYPQSSPDFSQIHLLIPSLLHVLYSFIIYRVQFVLPFNHVVVGVASTGAWSTYLGHTLKAN